MAVRYLEARPTAILDRYFSNLHIKISSNGGAFGGYGNLLQCLANLTVRKFFQMSNLKIYEGTL